MENKKERKFLKNVLMYSAFFAILIGFILMIFFKYRKSFIWQPDGLKQHVLILEYFRGLLTNFIKTGDFSTFTWNVGNGMNLYGNFAYYIFGDIFSYFSIFVPSKYIEYVYSALAIVRMYFIGISFMFFCNYKKMNRNSSVIGALMYTFCTFALFSAVRHPYFSNALILFPLVMVGIEKIVKEDKKVFYTMIISLIFISNFYFAYMICLVIAIYGISLIICTYKKDGIKKIISKTSQVLFYSIVGIIISAIILLPAGIEFFNSERSGTDNLYPYTIEYYRNLIKNLLDVKSNGYWMYWGVQSIIMITLPIFIRKRKEDYPTFFTILVLILPMLVTEIGSAFCGFAYPNNRWTFILSFMFAFITAKFINDGCKIEKKDYTAITCFAILFVFINIILQNQLSQLNIIQLLIFVLILIVIKNKEKLENKLKNLNLYRVLFVILFIIGIFSSEYFLYDIGNEKKGYVSEFIEIDTLSKRKNTSNSKISDFGKAIKYIKNNDNGLYSISKYPYDYENVSLVKGYKSIGSYFSIMPHYYSELALELQNSQYSLNYGLGEFDYRTKINTLLGSKYYIKNGDNNVIPYGYSKIDEYDGDSNIYVNNYALPFGMLYTSYINEEEYNNLNSLEKESSLLKTATIQDNNQIQVEHNESAINTIKNDDIKEIKYEIIDENNIINDNKVVIKNSTENQIKLKIKNVENSEIYLNIKNIHFEPPTKKEKINSETSKSSSRAEIKTIQEKYRWYEPDYEYKITVSFKQKTSSKRVRDYKVSPYYFKNDEMLMNLGYYDETSGDITLTFENIGTYDLSQIKIFAVSMNDYADDIANLKKSNFEVIEYKNGYLKASANPESDGVLQFATLYNKGWKVYVDGNEVSTFIANKYFLGINITKGEHQIEMKYTTPYLKEGLVISIIGILIFGIIIFSENFWNNTLKKRKER